MSRIFYIGLACGLVLLSACSKRKRSAEDEAKWADIQPLTNRVVAVASPTQEVAVASHTVIQSDGEDYSAQIARMKAMESVERAPGETLFTGEQLIFDYEHRLVQMEQHVQVVDDRGTLEAEQLTGILSESNELERVEAQQQVRVSSDARTATADRAVYVVKGGAIELDGAAQVFDGANQLAGEHIQFWMKGSRRMICEPNAFLSVTDTSGLVLGGVTNKTAKQSTEIWASRVMFDETRRLAILEGNVRIRDQRGAMDCGTAQLRLTKENVIDWIDARTNVTIWLGQEVVKGMGKGAKGRSMIRANRLFYQGDRKLAEFTDRVQVRDSRAAMDCGQLLLYLKGENEIDWIEARTDVIIQTDERKALADKAIYYAAEQKFILNGDPKLKQGQNIMMGDQITFWTETQRMVCEPNARVLLYPDETMKAKFMKDLDK